MGSKRFIPVILFIGLLVAGSYYYLCEIKQVCGELSLTAKVNPQINDSLDNGFQPLIFQFNSAEPVVGNAFNTYREELIAKVGESDTLLVNGKYYSNEKNGNELAQERADNVQSLLEGHFDLNRLKTQVNFDGMTKVDDKSNLEAVTFTIVSGNTDSTYENTGDNVEEWVDDSSVDSDVEEVDEAETADDAQSTYTNSDLDRAVIYFPKMSVKKSMTPEVRTFIDQLVSLMKSDPDVKVYVVGHSYDENDDGEMHQLGRRRAWVVKKMIWDKGVDPMRIITSSKGETEPVNTNNTEVDQAFNRRVEIIIDRQ